MSKRILGVLALIFSSFIWGVGPVISKQGLFEIPPFSLAFLRDVLAISIILPLTFKRLVKVKRSDLWALFLVGLFSSVLSPMLFLLGLERTSASVSSAIFAMVPLINGIAAGFILREKPALVRILGVVIGFLGSAIIALGPLILDQAKITGSVLGNFLIAGSVFTWVGYIIISKRLLEKYSALNLVAFSLIIGTVILFPLAFSETLSNPGWYLNVTQVGLFSILYGGLLGTVVAFTLFQWGLKYTSAFEAGMVVYLQPVLTDIFAIFLIGEVLSSLFLLGTALILGGVFLASTYELLQKRTNSE